MDKKVFRAFGALGLLIGLVTGMTASHVVTSLLGLLFTFVGGSVIALQNKLDDQNRGVAYDAIFCIASFCILGLFLGIGIGEWRLLSPEFWHPASSIATVKSDSNLDAKKYLKAEIADKIRSLDNKVRQGYITPEQGFQELRILLDEK